MHVSLIIRGILRITQKREEFVSKILFSKHFIMNVFILKPSFNAFSFVLRKCLVFPQLYLSFHCCHVLGPQYDDRVQLKSWNHDK